MEHTDTDIFRGPGGREAAGAVLHVAFHGHDPLRPPSRHALAGIDAISVGRDRTHAVRRDVHDGLRRLVVRTPDPLLSADHATLIHAGGAWVLDARAAKNAPLVGGREVRSCRIELEQPFVLGHLVCWIAHEPALADGPLDITARELPAASPELATFSPALAQAFDRLARLASGAHSVLLLGETGTGKEVVASAIAGLSRRRPFVAVNCGAIAPTLVEAELFGHRRGAFSGAVADRLGHVRSADGGTLFLDEIGDLPLQAQGTLLRVLQEGEVVPVGDSLPVRVDVRVIAATHRDLAAMIAARTFREDFYARIQDVVVVLPPLRERRCDLGALIGRLLARAGTGGGRLRFAPEVCALLFAYPWPRNVRELERALAVAVQLAGGDVVTRAHLPGELAAWTPGEAEAAAIAVEVAEPVALTAEDAALREQLVALIRSHGGNIAEVARQMNKDRTQIYRWMRRVGIPVDRTS